ncbi:MAG: hypothetical protein WA741_26510 [Candidatus Sulfotelmatobacter sp.]
MPEKAKRASTPKRVLHVSSFAVFEVGLKGRVVGVRVSFDFNVSLDGCATGVAQPNLAWLALVITRFTEEGPAHRDAEVTISGATRAAVLRESIEIAMGSV